MAKKKAGKRVRRHPCSDAIHERVASLDDAVQAALGSISEQVGDDGATVIVSDTLLMFAAAITWHATTATEEEFANAARDCYRRIAASHANCKRGAPPDHGLRREDLN